MLEPHLRVITPRETHTLQLRVQVLLLYLLLEVKVVLLKVYYNHGDVVFAVEIGAGLIGYPLRDLPQRHSLLPQVVDHGGHLLFRVNPVEPVGGQNEQVVVRLYLIVVGLRFRYQVLLLLHVADGPADG